MGYTPTGRMSKARRELWWRMQNNVSYEDWESTKPKNRWKLAHKALDKSPCKQTSPLK